MTRPYYPSDEAFEWFLATVNPQTVHLEQAAHASDDEWNAIRHAKGRAA